MLAMPRQMSVSCPWPRRVRLCSLLLAGALSALLPGFALAAPSPTLADYRATYEKELGKIRTNNAPVVAADNDNNPGSRQFNYSFKGRIDEIMVFTRALTDAEIKQIYGMQKQ